MASIALMVGSAAVNAFAFSGTSYPFSKMSKDGADTEQKKHDAAVEQLQRATVEWNQRRTERMDFVAEWLRREGHAVQVNADDGEIMRLYNVSTGKKLQPLPREPRLSDFYVPSEAQKDRVIAFIALGTAAVGLVAYYLL